MKNRTSRRGRQVGRKCGDAELNGKAGKIIGMNQSPNMSPDGQTETQGRPREELVQLAISEIRRYLDDENVDGALAQFRQLHPVDQGEVLVGISESNRLQLLESLSPGETADILAEMEPQGATRLSKGMQPEALAHILEQTKPDAAADILQLLPEEYLDKTLQSMSDAPEVASLLEYGQDTAGGLMTLDYPVIKESLTTPNALDELRLLGPEAENINALLVVDGENRLVGSLSIARLALARPTSMIGEIAEQDIISVSAETDQEECARLMERYNLIHLPVVDQDGRLTGVILAEDMVDVVEEEATEDMYRIASVAGERVMGPLRNSLRRRLPWLYINLATALLAGLMISIFESTITKVIALAVFLPVVAGQGGIGGTQTVTLVVRSMALGEVPRNLGFRLLSRELSLALIHGILLGLVVGLVAYGWKGNATLGLVLGLAMLGNMVVAGLAGAGVPLLLRRLGMDPAVSSAVFVTTFTDVIGFLLFLGLAAAFINLLV